MEVKNVLPKDAIPSVEGPTFAPASERPDAVSDDDRVIVVEPSAGSRTDDGSEHRAGDGNDGNARAYPVRYLHFHEIVNDVLDSGVPIAVTWCPLCGSAVVYDRRVGDGRVLEFGVSGKLADDDLVMYDRETESEWKQSLGVAITGPLAGTDLTVLPAATTTVSAFRRQFPEGLFMEPPGGASEAASDDDEPAAIDYDDAPYEAYFERDGFGLAAHRGTGGRDWNRDDLDPKAVVLGIERDGESLGVPLPVVERADGVVTASAGELDVVVFATDDGIHAFEDPGCDWRRVPGGFRAEGAQCDGILYDGATGAPVDAPAAHTGDGGSRNAAPLRRIPARRLFAFAWQDDHGPDAFLLDPER
ncbi:hypothetical protein AArcSl_1088 [Halalkaliarchaeum desulfuricum]|uniref:DUF3179 domain-containing protein n=1 Tax=Halalkaliarchaeum desulfuricum TaxID=2055893 RepID=A0A343TI01_9EURY|nr:DUF3179 domain-containing protein [Halalkaliarchaeum desulfuricum]AUX08723.1 hypothetical protein AArcSl_1088 [Halalkaliarchaeum desulfuricum]